MSRVAERGQATVEMVGMTVVVALLVAATSAWLVRAVRPPDAPPDAIGAVAAPLHREPAPFDYAYPLPGRGFQLPLGRDDEPIGRVLRIVGRGAREGFVVAIEMRHAFARAYAMRLRDRAEGLLRDPLGELVRPNQLTLEGAARSGLLNAGRLWAYGRELRSLPLREAALRAAADAGALAADLTVDAAKRAGRERLDRVGDRTSREP
jgi:hypothetical protein